jgi:hypothetical protein
MVLWAWTAFIPAGFVIQKTSEHWSKATPGGHRGATAAFDILTVTSVLAAGLMLLAIAAAIPALLRALRADAWPQLRRRVLVAGTLSVAFAIATVGLVAWAHGLSAAQRNGTDGTYAAGFVTWGLVAVATLTGWTAVAARASAIVEFDAAIAALQSRIVCLVAAGMSVMTAATVVWYVLVADRAPAALTGAMSQPGTVFVGRLIAAMTVMVIAGGVGVAGARQSRAA